MKERQKQNFKRFRDKMRIIKIISNYISNQNKILHSIHTSAAHSSECLLELEHTQHQIKDNVQITDATSQLNIEDNDINPSTSECLLELEHTQHQITDNVQITDATSQLNIEDNDINPSTSECLLELEHTQHQITDNVQITDATSQLNIEDNDINPSTSECLLEIEHTQNQITDNVQITDATSQLNIEDNDINPSTSECLLELEHTQNQITDNVQITDATSQLNIEDNDINPSTSECLLELEHTQNQITDNVQITDATSQLNIEDNDINPSTSECLLELLAPIKKCLPDDSGRNRKGIQKTSAQRQEEYRNRVKMSEALIIARRKADAVRAKKYRDKLKSKILSSNRDSLSNARTQSRNDEKIGQIHDFTVFRRKCLMATAKSFPTTKELLEKLKEHLDYSSSASSLKNILHLTGFMFERVKSSHHYQLVENEDIRLRREEFLKEINLYRGLGGDIVYAGYMILDTENGYSDNGQYIITLAGSEWGLMMHALHVFAIDPIAENGDENLRIYKTWFCQNLLPNIRSDSYIILDESPYNDGLQLVPSCSFPKAVMVSWLTKNNIVFDQNMTREQLYELINENKNKCLEYNINKAIIANGHKILRLPSLSPDLNPLKTVWRELKNYVSDKIVKEMTPVKVTEIVLEKLQFLERNVWQKLLNDAFSEGTDL